MAPSTKCTLPRREIKPSMLGARGHWKLPHAMSAFMAFIIKMHAGMEIIIEAEATKLLGVRRCRIFLCLLSRNAFRIMLEE